MKALFFALVLAQPGLSQQTLGVITGRVLSADGQPAANVRVALIPAGQDGPMLRMVQTDSSGLFRIEGALPGRYHIAAGSLYRPTYLPGVVLRNTASVLTLNAGASVDAGEFRLDKSSGPRVKGRVGRTADGQLPVLELDRIGGGPERRTRVTVAADGSFEVSELQPGTYEVYLATRVVATFVLDGTDVTDLVLTPR